MKVGEYVRTDNCIGKVYDICHKEEDYYKFIIENHGTLRICDSDYIVESSPNIIDLIEVGDVLVVKDFVDEACMIFTDIYLIQNEQQLINIKSDLEKNKNKKLYSIVTSEQFSQMEYKVNKND